MLTWGFLLLVGGFASCLIFFLSEVKDVIHFFGKWGFGGYIAAFFDPANLSPAKIIFVLSAVLAVVGLVLYIVGRILNKGEKNPIIPAKVKKYLRDTKGEFKKIVWPNFSTVARNTGVVLIMCAVTFLVIWGVDALCAYLVDVLVNLK